MEELFVFCCVIFVPYVIVSGDTFSTVVPIKVELNRTIESALRYGFQKTGECLNFEKSFICIQKCLDLNYDVAYADANCKCTCHIKQEKAKYTLKYNFTRTNWKLGAPTTTIPPWAQGKKKAKELDNQLITELDHTESVQEMVDIDLSNSTTNPASTNNISTETSANATGTPGGLVETGAVNGSLPNGTTIANLENASSGTEAANATDTVANLATDSAANTAVTTAHEGTNTTVPAENNVTQ